MDRREPVVQRVEAAEVGQRFGGLLGEVSREEVRVLVEDGGVPVAAIVSAEDLRRLTRWEAEWAEDYAVLMAIGEHFKDVSEEEIEREVANALAEVRAEEWNGTERVNRTA